MLFFSIVGGLERANGEMGAELNGEDKNLWIDEEEEGEER